MSESNADVYTSFGVNPAVVTGSSASEHEQNMLALDVAARDGDDAITLDDVDTNDDPYGNPKDPFGQENDEGRIQVRIGEEGEPTEDVIESEGEATSEEFSPLEDIPEGLSNTSSQLEMHEQGLADMIATAVERGLSQEAVERIQNEYETTGITDKSYEELAAIGYSRAFIDSFVRGQEALVESYVAGVKAYAGGEEKFGAIVKHLETSNPDAAQSLMTAIENRDLGTVKAIINLAGASRDKAFGRKPERSVATKGLPAKAAPKKAEGFASRAEMVKAMSDPRYRLDSAYRRSVEQKVYASNF